ncbi:MAG: glutamate racemase [Deltaproteobacteria bacterium]|nr:MAG: glutamate racemase [Deltaproteobacteria bacterium]TNF25172.1 MAG: glutamate racemase [Deltaproteobacteria bacterium]
MERTTDGQIRIGIMDSGIGGFSILAEIHQLLPGVEISYFADDKNAPYGNLSSEAVVEHTRAAIQALIGQGAELIVLACNSATAVAIDQMRTEFQIPFVGVEPYVNVIHKQSFDLSKDRIGILTTTMTGESKRFKQLLDRFDPNGHLHAYKSPHLAQLIEQLFKHGWEKDITDKIIDELSFVKTSGLTHLILGCTHYPLIGEFIDREFDLKVISPCPHVARRVKELLPNLDDTMKKVTTFNFYSSIRASWVEQNFSSLLGALRPLPKRV